MANYDVELNIPGTEKCFDFLFLAPYARTTRYEEAFLPTGIKRPRLLRSLGLASLLGMLYYCSSAYRSNNRNPRTHRQRTRDLPLILPHV